MEYPTLTRNGEALRNLAAELLREHVKYDQQQWGTGVVTDETTESDGASYRRVAVSCKSHACIAGTQVLAAGHHLVVPSTDFGVVVGGYTTVTQCWNGTDVVPIFTQATRDLGLHDAEANLLFSGNWRPAEGLSVWEAVEKLASGARLSDVTDEQAKASIQVNVCLAPDCDDCFAAGLATFETLDACPIEII